MASGRNRRRQFGRVGPRRRTPPPIPPLAWRYRHAHIRIAQPANDNREPLARLLKRYAYVAVAGIGLIALLLWA